MSAFLGQNRKADRVHWGGLKKGFCSKISGFPGL